MEKYYYTVDFSKVEIYSEIHEVLMRDLDLPDYYGCNLDALYDCLTDMIARETIIEINGFENIERKFDDTWKKILECFVDAKHFVNNECFDRFDVDLIHEDGRREKVK